MPRGRIEDEGMTAALFHALRPKQWTKNAVVLAAFLFACGDPSQSAYTAGLGPVLRVAAAALLFCVISSGIYLLNDLLDVKADRAHPVKRLRPIASGALPVSVARVASGALLVGGLAAAGALSREFARVAAAYVVLQVAYSTFLKRIPLVDSFVIAIGFVLRAVAGAEVVQVRISPWLLLCTFLLALFLALCKRRHETGVESVDPEGVSHRAALKGYDAPLLDRLIGITASATIVCYAIYTLSEETVERFGTHRLGLTIPFVIFGIFRYLDLVYRHREGGRPEQILLTDRVLLVDIVLYVLVVAAVLAPWAR
jgi:4-hydroxybenzoate polyprenyltransferase